MPYSETYYFSPAILASTVISKAGALQWREPVDTYADLLLIAFPEPGETRIVLDEDAAYTWDDVSSSWVPIDKQGYGFTLGPTPPPTPQPGFVWANSNDSTLYQYDGTRGKWLGLSEMRISAARDIRRATKIFLEGIAGVPTNLVKEYIKEKSTVVAMVALNRSGTPENWTAELRVNGTTAATLSIVNTDLAVDVNLNVDVNAGDRIELYCNGVNVNRPRIDVYLRKRY